MLNASGEKLEMKSGEACLGRGGDELSEADWREGPAEMEWTAAGNDVLR